MRRREFLAIAGAAAAFPRVALGQQVAKVPRIAFLMNLTAPPSLGDFQGFSQGLADFGYIENKDINDLSEQLSNLANVEGKNITIEFFLAPTPADLPAFAAKAVASKPDIVMAVGTPGTQALKAATSTIPIVANTDLLGSGFAASLAHPGGNITGVSTVGADLGGKRLAILKETVPTVRRIAILNIPGNAAIEGEAAAGVMTETG